MHRPVRRLGLIVYVREFIDAIREGLELATRYKILTHLNDQELASMGMKRKDIPRVVVSGWKH